MIPPGRLEDLRELSKCLSRGQGDLADPLKVILSDPDWSETHIGMGAIAHRLISEAVSPSTDYATLAVFIASIYPAINKFVPMALEELLFRVDSMLEFDSAPPASIKDETEEERLYGTAVAGICLFLLGVDPWVESSWSRAVGVLDEANEIWKKL